MTKFRLLLASLVVLFGLALIPTETQAYDFGGRQTWNVQGFGVSGNLYGLGFIPTPPYYAIHPPVYNGQRYFRTYGESPWARPARSSRPFNVDVQMGSRPYLAPRAVAPPQMIYNPFYKAAEEVAPK